LFVGDSIAHDYYGAQRAGINFCWFQGDRERPDEVRPRYSIRDLCDLVRVLGLTGHRIE
jgi:FMN phosphatase YigB (HAD superfamily)